MSEFALSERALVTVPEARRYVFRDEQDTSRDGILVDAVNMVSDAILADPIISNRELTPADGETRTFELDTSGFVDLRPYELRSIDAIVVHPDRDAADQLTLDADDYRAFPIGGSTAGTFLWLQLKRPSLAQLYDGFGWQVAVTGDWGMAAIPESLKMACLIWVKNIVENPGAYAVSSMAGYTVVPETDTVMVAGGAGMPAATRWRLHGYRRELLLV